jgi:hypothetical protein
MEMVTFSTAAGNGVVKGLQREAVVLASFRLLQQLPQAALCLTIQGQISVSSSNALNFTTTEDLLPLPGHPDVFHDTNVPSYDTNVLPSPIPAFIWRQGKPNNHMYIKISELIVNVCGYDTARKLSLRASQ